MDMEWLKTILSKEGIVKEGKVDVAAVLEDFKKEFPLHAVPKEDYNTKVKELETAARTIEELKEAGKDNEELANKVKAYEDDIKKLQKAAADTAKGYALKENLAGAGVLDPDYLIYKHGGLEKFTFDKENKPVGVDDVLKAYREDKTLAHLFKQEEHTGYKPAGGSGGQNANPFAKESYNLTEQGRLLRSNPEQARALAAAAGVTI